MLQINEKRQIIHQVMIIRVINKFFKEIICVDNHYKILRALHLYVYINICAKMSRRGNNDNFKNFSKQYVDYHEILRKVHQYNVYMRYQNVNEVFGVC